ncbi:MAG: diguanylate cyclase [Candidatus Omnitrophica bacterium]|nr:diguanylate cyclase [Candidatus Omnitrophota bacterium]MDD5573854.1 diguanylate cyclase [Candidatus Omnitrophota bacterium]
MSKNKKILLVIEDQNLDKILSYLLKAWNYDVVVCPDGTRALSVATQQYPDLIIIDAHLTKTDGLKLCKILKHDFITSYIPIIILIEKRQLRRNLLDIEQGVDDFLIKPPDPIDLEIRIALSLRSAAHQFHANALTKLPGNKSIEKLVKSHIETDKSFSFAYVDINNFKSFNDKYGYIAGDQVILQTAKILTSAVKKFGNTDDFVGHVGGDDFVYVTTPQREEIIAQECITEFNRLIPLHYTAQDRQNGHIKAKDRSGHLSNIPLMGLSIAIVNNRNFTVASIFQLIEVAFEIKNFLKKHHASNYLVNRRITDSGLHERKGLQEEYSLELKKHHPHVKSYKPIGQIMLETHLLNENQLNETLHYHWTTGQRLGEAAVSMGFVDEADIKRLIDHQPSFHKTRE